MLFDLQLPAQGLYELRSYAGLELLDDKDASPNNNSACGDTLEIEIVDYPPEYADLGIADDSLIVPPTLQNYGDSIVDHPLVDEDPIDGIDNDNDGAIGKREY